MADPTVQGPLSAASTTSETSEPTAALSTIGQPVKFTGGGKGTLGTITPTAGAILDENSSKAILANMQNMLDEYSSPKKGLEDALMKAHAWTMYNKEPMFRQIQQQEEQDRANKYNISQGMASIQAMQNQNKILQEEMSGGAKTAGAGVGAGVGTGIPGIPGNQQDYARYLKRTNPVEFEKLLTSYNVKQPDALKIMDAVKGMEDTPQNREILRQTFPKSFEPQVTVDANGARHESMPDIGALFRQANAPTATGVPVFNDPSIRITSTQRNAQQGKDLYQTSVDAGTPGVQPNGIPVAKPGTSPHETLPAGDVLDIDPSKLTTSGRTELAQKGYYQPYGKDSPHWQKIPPVGTQTTTATTLPAMKAALQPGAQPTTGDIPSPLAGDTSVPGVAAKYANLQEQNKAFINGEQKTLADAVYAQRNDERNAERVLESLHKADFGPGSSVEQLAIEAKMAAEKLSGQKLVTPEEEARYFAGKTIENVKQTQVALGAKAAMGAQYTGKESDNYAKTLAGINDKNTYIKTIYQIQMAKAKLDKAHLNYLRQNQADPVTAEANWTREGGLGEKKANEIYQANVDEFRKMHTDQAAREWLAKNPNDPKAAKVREQLGDKQ